MKQISFASLEYVGKKRRTRREKFLGDMERVVPWARLIALIEPHYPSSGRVVRPPIGVPRMLRMYFLQQWYFGMKAHIGADAESGLVHSVHATAANESDVAHTHEVLHGEEESVHLDAGYTGVRKRAEMAKRAPLDGHTRGTVTP